MEIRSLKYSVVIYKNIFLGQKHFGYLRLDHSKYLSIKKTIISSLNNENLLNLEITILRGESNCALKGIPLHESGFRVPLGKKYWQ